MKNEGFQEEFDLFNSKIFNSKNINKINFRENKKHKIKVIKFYKSLYEPSNGLVMKDLSVMMKFISDKMTDETIKISELQLT